MKWLIFQGMTFLRYYSQKSYQKVFGFKQMPMYISNRIRKNVPQLFAWVRAQPESRPSWDSKPRGDSVNPGSGGWPSAWAICWWLAGGQLSKAGGRGGCLVCTPPLS